MVIPLPGVEMPMIRSPGTAPSGEKRTGMSLAAPRIGIARFIASRVAAP